MKYPRLALVIFASAVAVVHAQDEERRAPLVEIPDFSNLDEYIYEPKSTVRLGFRNLSGAKTQFSGQGTVRALETYDPAKLGPTDQKVYHDGSVLPDARVTSRLDAAGNPMIDPQSGTQLSDPAAPDGRTNSWSYSDAKQVDPAVVPNGYIAFHSYSADVVDTAIHGSKSRSTSGLDLTVSRDMGKLWGNKLTWALMAGMSVNDISARKLDFVEANLRTITDLYSLYGQAAPTAPYTAPSPASSQTVTNSDGTTQTVSIDTTVLLGNEPAATNITPGTVRSSQSVMNNWKVKGAFYTFRGGAEVWFPITSRLRAGVGLGAAVVYAGTNYTVIQTMTPDIGVDITETDTNSAYKLLPGYYADATLQFDLTEKAGFFAGAVFQSASSYKQSVNSETSHYTTKIDLSNQNGVRAGMSIRF